MTKDKKTPEEITKAELDQVTGGATAYIGETEKNLPGTLKPKSSSDRFRTPKTGIEYQDGND